MFREFEIESPQQTKKLKQKIKQKQIIRTKIRIINKRIMRMKIIIERKKKSRTNGKQIRNI